MKCARILTFYVKCMNPRIRSSTNTSSLNDPSNLKSACAWYNIPMYHNIYVGTNVCIHKIYVYEYIGYIGKKRQRINIIKIRLDPVTSSAGATVIHGPCRIVYYIYYIYVENLSTELINFGF